MFWICAGIFRLHIKSSVFPLANLNPVCIAQCCKLFSTFCSFIFVSLSSLSVVIEIRQSSTKSDFWNSGGMKSKMVFIASRKSVQLIELPWGTPRSSRNFSESLSPIFTLMLLFSRKFWMYQAKCPFMLNFTSWSKITCFQQVSYAFSISRNIDKSSKNYYFIQKKTKQLF